MKTPLELANDFVDAMISNDENKEGDAAFRLTCMIDSGEISGDAALFLEGAIDDEDKQMSIEQAEAAIEVLRGSLPSGIKE